MSELHELFEFMLDITKIQITAHLRLQDLIERASQVSKEIEEIRKADPILGELGEKKDGCE